MALSIATRHVAARITPLFFHHCLIPYIDNIGIWANFSALLSALPKLKMGIIAHMT